MTLQPVILCGGSGTRLWPASREEHPKQLLSLLGGDSLLQATLHRLDGFAGASVLPPLVIGNEKYRFLIDEQLHAGGLQQPLLLLEPVGRNTAPALTIAAVVASSQGADPLLLAMPADHVIADEPAFRAAVARGLAAAEAGDFVTFGVVPTRAETGYGYLRRGVPKAGVPGAFVLDAFVEKPDAKTAEAYLASGEYLWNSGIFLVRASTWLAAVAALQPAMHRACLDAVQRARRDGDFLRVDREAFACSPADSIDYAVMEKLHDHPGLGGAVVVPLDARWSDVGAWDSLRDIADHDASGNVARGDVLLEGCRDSLVLAQSRLVATLGCEGVVVVETPDAVLVADQRRSQDVKKLVERLKAGQREEASTPRKVFRPWGWYDSLEKGPGFQVKRIGVKPGASLSLQMHHRRAEHWVVVRGVGHVTNGDRVFDLNANESTYIPIGTRHRLENLTSDPLEIIEVQTGDYLGEDDIVRFEDRYARIES
ncbi:MAG: mannose-1-phosphate guanylyltransferase/mannose-6-phosphate isomerase [Rhodanobacteraceae bacterium]|nr:MAG: mannose-1-phosphate guanylyltransferase/mannose-6-phosphate isomerase [Rhodanobacteraceae bacterium]